MANVGAITFDLLANIASYVQDMDKSVTVAATTAAKIASSFDEMHKASDSLIESVTKLGEAFLVFKAVEVGTEAFKKFTEVSSEAEKQIKLVNQAIVSTGGAAGVSSEAVEKYATSMRLMAGTNQEAVVGAEGLLLRFTKIHGETFPLALKAARDLSVGMGIGLSEASMKLGKALENPEKAAGSLRKANIVLDQSQQDLIKSFTAVGDIADAQKVIIDAIEKSYGGAAAAARDTLGGAFQALNSDTEELIKTMGLPGGLRDVVELTDGAIIDFTKTIEDLKDPTTKAGQQLQAYGQVASKMFSDFTESTKAWADVTIYVLGWFPELFNKTIAQPLEIAGSAVHNFLYKTVGEYQQISDLIGGGFAENFQHEWDKLNKHAEDDVKKGIVPDYLGHLFDPIAQGMDRVSSEVQTKLAKIKAEAAGYAPKTSADDSGDGADAKAAKKATDEIGKEQKAIEGVIDAFTKKNAELQLQADGETKLKDLAEAIAKINAQENISVQQKAVLIGQLVDLENKREAIQKQIKENDESKKLADYAKSMTEANDLQAALLGKSKEEAEVIKAEAAIRKTLNGDMQLSVDTQKQILKYAQDKADLDAKADQAASLKAADAELKTLEETVKENELKAQGLEKQIPLYKEIQKFQDDPNLSDASKKDAIDRATELNDQNDHYLQVMTDQKDAIDAINNSTASYDEKLKTLKQDLDANIITQQQWEDESKKLTDAQNKTKDSTQKLGDSLAKSVTSEIGKIADGTETAAQGFKNMGKALEQFALQALVLKPLESFITKIGNALTGNGNKNGSNDPTFNTTSNSPFAASNGALSPAFGAPAGGGGLFSSLIDTIFGSGKSSANGSSSSGGLLSSALSSALTSLIGKHANGGIAPSGQLAMFGEQGPELAIPSQDMQIFTAAQTQQYTSQLTGGPVLTPAGWSSTLDGNQTLPINDQEQVNQILQSANKIKLYKQAQALPNDSPYKAELDYESTIGYNPMLTDGKAFTADGRPENVLNFGHAYDQIAKAALLAGIPMPGQLAADLQGMDSYQNQQTNNGSYVYGNGVSGGGSSFGGGDGGADGSTGYNDGTNLQHQQDQFAADHLFGDAGHVNLQGEGYAGGSKGATAFGNFVGGTGQGGGNTYNTGTPYLPGTTVHQGVANITPYDPSQQTPSSYPGLESSHLNLPELAQGTPAQMAQLEKLANLAQGTTSDSYPAYGPAIGSPVGVSLGASDVFNQDQQSFTSYQKALTDSKQFSPQSSVDNSGLADGMISAILTKLPKRRTGGGVGAGGSYYVGEDGPEIFQPSNSGTILPHAAGGGAPNITINNNHSGVAPGDISVSGSGNNIVVSITKAIASNLANNGTTASVMRDRYGLLATAPRRS